MFSSACIAGILRLTTTIAVRASTDATWDTVNIYLWTAVEAAVGLVCSCFPVVSPLFTFIKEKIRSSRGDSNAPIDGARDHSGASEPAAKRKGRMWAHPRDSLSDTKTSDGPWIRLEAQDHGSHDTVLIHDEGKKVSQDV